MKVCFPINSSLRDLPIAIRGRVSGLQHARRRLSAYMGRVPARLPSPLFAEMVELEPEYLSDGSEAVEDQILIYLYCPIRVADTSKVKA
jgi:hypothetical protein